MGLEHNVCYLGITGFIPDEEGFAVLGQPFLQNYYTVLNMENNKIGLGAHIGTEAEISPVVFTNTMFIIKLTLTLSMILIFAVIGRYMCKFFKARSNIKYVSPENRNEAI